MKLPSVAVTSHTAAPAALGYIYQGQWPLLALLRADRQDCQITLELHDDVAWDRDGTPTDLLQLKHHINDVRGLGDKDADWWRTIQAWIDAHDPADAASARESRAAASRRARAAGTSRSGGRNAAAALPTGASCVVTRASVGPGCPAREQR